MEGGGAELREMDIWEKTEIFSSFSHTCSSISITLTFSPWLLTICSQANDLQLFYFFNNQACLGDKNVMCVISFFPIGRISKFQSLCGTLRSLSQNLLSQNSLSRNFFDAQSSRNVILVVYTVECSVQCTYILRQP